MMQRSFTPLRSVQDDIGKGYPVLSVAGFTEKADCLRTVRLFWRYRLPKACKTAGTSDATIPFIQSAPKRLFLRKKK